MTGDWAFDLCVLAMGFSVMATSILLGFLWGNSVGKKSATGEAVWAHNSWQYVEQKK